MKAALWILPTLLLQPLLVHGTTAADRAERCPAATGMAAVSPLEAWPASHERAGAAVDGSRDFDFEFGTWTTRLSRLVKPLAGSTEWVEYEGTSVVRPVWNGRANLGELEVEGPTGRIQGLSLRLYDPASGEWRISWANSRNGIIGPPMIGGFKDGKGEFYNQETFDGRAIFVRFIFSDITANSFRLEQAFSDDGGRTWEANWVAAFERAADQPASPELGICTS